MTAVQAASNGLSMTTSTRPAEPLLASHLIGEEDLEELLASVCNVNFQSKKKAEENRLQTGLKSLDEALGGGLKGGRVVGISGPVGAGANEVSKSKT